MSADVFRPHLTHSHTESQRPDPVPRLANGSQVSHSRKPVSRQYLAKILDNLRIYNRLTKNATISGFIIEGQGNFGATFGLKTGQFTWHSVASQFCVGHLILDPVLECSWCLILVPILVWFSFSNFRLFYAPVQRTFNKCERTSELVSGNIMEVF